MAFSVEDHSIRFAHGGLFAAFSLHARSLSRQLKPRQRQAVMLIKDALAKLKQGRTAQPHFSRVMQLQTAERTIA